MIFRARHDSTLNWRAKEMQPIDVRLEFDNITGLFTDMLADDTRKIVMIAEPAATAAYTVRGNDGRLGTSVHQSHRQCAVVFPDGGTVTVRAKPNGSKIEIAIEDEGPGIPSDKLGQIFDRFYSDRPQTDASTARIRGSVCRSRARSSPAITGNFAENRAVNATDRTKGARLTVRLPLSAEQGAGLAWRG